MLVAKLLANVKFALSSRIFVSTLSEEAALLIRRKVASQRRIRRKRRK
jgi:hypothetical protein